MNNLIFSSKSENVSLAKQGAIYGVIYVFFIFAPFLLHWLLGMLALIFDIFCVIGIVFTFIGQSKAPAMSNSFIDVFNDHIEGVSIPNPLTISNAMNGKRVNLNYEEIERVEASATNHIVTIRTKFESYDFNATTCADKVMNLIKKQISI